MSISLMRAKVLSYIAKYEKDHKKPISISELSRLTGIPNGTTLIRYLKELDDRDLIEMKRNTKIRGYPVLIKTTNKADPVALGFMEWLEKATPILFDDDKEKEK